MAPSYRKVEEHYAELMKIVARATKRTSRKSNTYGWESKTNVEEKEELTKLRNEISALEYEIGNLMAKDARALATLEEKHGSLRYLVLKIKQRVAYSLLEVYF